MQFREGNFMKPIREKAKLANNNDLDGLIERPLPKSKRGRRRNMSVFKEHLLRSKQLVETSELVCISSA